MHPLGFTAATVRTSAYQHSRITINDDPVKTIFNAGIGHLSMFVTHISTFKFLNALTTDNHSGTA